MGEGPSQDHHFSVAKAYRGLFCVISLLVGVGLLYGGIKLLVLGGSAYYLLAGLAYVVLAILAFLQSGITLVFNIVVFLATIIWALCDVPTFGFWAFLPRLVIPAIVFGMGQWAVATFSASSLLAKRLNFGSGVAMIGCLLVALAESFLPHAEIKDVEAIYTKKHEPLNTVTDKSENWEFFGRNADGTRFAPYKQITPENVKQLKVAWVYHTGRRTKGAAIGVDEDTPEQIGNVLYSCTPESLITALDADTGKMLWKYDAKAHAPEHVSCRGVGYYDFDKDTTLTAEEKTANTSQICRQRILGSTVDGRLFALDAHTGALCQDFGVNGTVDVTKQIGPAEKGKRYHPSAMPVVLGHIVVLGSWVRDIVHGEPSGVVRAYDTRNGSLVWAWDVGNPDNNGAPPEGQTYTLETPNVWAVPSFDKDLNLVYLPTGNGPPDYWGGDRPDYKEKFGAAIVAVDASTGKTKWVFQTVHHDIWDYDLPSQPVLYNFTNAQGEKVPALIQTTKWGNIFVLDRRTGKPITAVEEHPVPTNGAEGEHVSPTQPFSVGMPVIGAAPLTEKSMWGVSTFDQLYCRILYKNSVYEGPFTPPSEKDYIEWPSVFGGLNWGGISIDESRDIMFVNDMSMPLRMKLVKKEEASKYKISTDEIPGFTGTVRPQIAGPYAGVRIDVMQSPLQIPCNTPSFGTMTAVDLKSKKIMWRVPMGTAKELGPYGVKSHMPMPIGMPTLGGPTSTASGLVFFAGTQDYYVRALDSLTGKEVWRQPLPVAAVSAPLVYRSPKTGKEYVVVSAGGASHSPDLGDYIIAYTLPETSGK